MRRVLVIAVGPGDPEQVTLQAVRAMNEADVFFVLGKGEDAAPLLEARRALCERFIVHADWRFVVVPDPERDRAPDDYADAVNDWHDRRADSIGAAIAAELPEDGVGAILVWGDPSLYDSTLRVLDRIAAAGIVPFERDIIPGVSSLQALAARFGTVLNEVGGAVLVTTGRRLEAEGMPENADNVVVMLDGAQAFTMLKGRGLRIFWAANLGTCDEALASGPLDEIADTILTLRDTVRARAGWVLDIYLLRRTA